MYKWHVSCSITTVPFTCRVLVVSTTHLKGKNPLVLKLVTEMKYNFEGEHAANEAKLSIKRIKDRAQVARKCAILFAILYNTDECLRNKESSGGTDLFENVDGMEGDEVYTNIEAAVHAAGENNDNIDDEDFRIVDWKQDPGERATRIWDYWRTIINEKPHLSSR